MTKYADDISEWRLRLFWPYVAVAIVFTLAAVFCFWLLLNDGKVWSAFGLIIVVALWWWYILYAKPSEYLRFDKNGISHYHHIKLYDKSLTWKKCSHLSFDWYDSHAGGRSLVLIRLVFHSIKKAKGSSIAIPMLLWPQVLFRLDYINQLAGKNVANKRELFFSFLKTIGKIFAYYVIGISFSLGAVWVLTIHFNIPLWITAVIILVAIILFGVVSKIDIPNKYD